MQSILWRRLADRKCRIEDKRYRIEDKRCRIGDKRCRIGDGGIRDRGGYEMQDWRYVSKISRVKVTFSLHSFILLDVSQ